MTYSLGTLAAVYQYLKFDSGTGFFTAGNTIIGATSGATATIVSVIGRGEASGRVYLTDIVGTFQDNEIIYESALGGELLTNGNFTNWTDDNPDSWTVVEVGDATSNITENPGGQCQIISDGTHVYITQDIFTKYSFYKVSIDIKTVTDGTLLIHDNSGSDANHIYATYTTTGVKTLIGQSLGVYTGLYIQRLSGNSVNMSFDDTSVKKITNAALANGILQDTESAVTLVPDYSYKSPEIKIESKSRTRAGKLYSTKYGSYKHISFNVDYVSSATAALVNSWWETDTELLFFITSGGTTETHSVMLQGETPIGGFNAPSIEYYRGKINLETY